MNTKNSILLISDDGDLSKLLKSKLIFLRNNDEIILSDFKNALSNLRLCNADIVLVSENSSQKDTLELIKTLRENKGLCIILLVNSYDKEMILAGYDAGIDDFALSSADDFELVIRVVNNIKHNSLKLKGFRNIKILEQLNVIDELTGLYNYNYAKQVIENVIDDNLLDDASFVAIAPSEDSKTRFSVEKMAQAVLSSIRSDDVATLGRGAKFYLLLPKTNFNGAIVVLNKIKENYGENFEICAGISGITNKNFEEIEHDALQALSDAIATNAEYVLSQEKEETLDDWLEDVDSESKNYKIFRQIFNKKLEKVIAPVFFRLQKAWEEKLFDTKIEQYTDSEQCVFHLKNKNQDSTLRIVYPGFAKIVIYITHEGLDSPENNEIQLSLTKISQKELISIVENFIKDFKYTSI
jgi:response regulator receiver domain